MCVCVPVHNLGLHWQGQGEPLRGLYSGFKDCYFTYFLQDRRPGARQSERRTGIAEILQNKFIITLKPTLTD